MRPTKAPLLTKSDSNRIPLANWEESYGPTWDLRRRNPLPHDSAGPKCQKLTGTYRRSSKNAIGCKPWKEDWINLTSASCINHFATIQLILDRVRILSTRAADRRHSISNRHHSVIATLPSDRWENDSVTCGATTLLCPLP